MPATSAWGADAASGSGAGTTRQFQVEEGQRPPDRGPRDPRRGRRRLRTILLVLAVLLAVAALAWSVQYLLTQGDPSAKAPGSAETAKTTPEQTAPSKTPSTTTEDQPTNPEYGSQQWLQQLNSTLATLEAESLIEEDVADHLRDRIDDTLEAYAEGDDKRVERELSHLNRDLTKGFQVGDLPEEGPLTTLFERDFTGDGGNQNFSGESDEDGEGSGNRGEGRYGGPGSG